MRSTGGALAPDCREGDLDAADVAVVGVRLLAVVVAGAPRTRSAFPMSPVSGSSMSVSGVSPGSAISMAGIARSFSTTSASRLASTRPARARAAARRCRAGRCRESLGQLRRRVARAARPGSSTCRCRTPGRRDRPASGSPSGTHRIADRGSRRSVRAPPDATVEVDSSLTVWIEPSSSRPPFAAIARAISSPRRRCRGPRRARFPVRAFRAEADPLDPAAGALPRRRSGDDRSSSASGIARTCRNRRRRAASRTPTRRRRARSSADPGAGTAARRAGCRRP